MKKTLFLLLLTCLFFPTRVSADDYIIKIGNIDCSDCVEKIYDFFGTYGKQVQHFKVNSERTRVMFDSISIDQDALRNQLENVGFEVIDVARLKA